MWGISLRVTRHASQLHLTPHTSHTSHTSLHTSDGERADEGRCVGRLAARAPAGPALHPCTLYPCTLRPAPLRPCTLRRRRPGQGPPCTLYPCTQQWLFTRGLWCVKGCHGV